MESLPHYLGKTLEILSSTTTKLKGTELKLVQPSSIATPSTQIATTSEQHDPKQTVLTNL